MTIYIVARPVDDMKQFLPVYITTHKKKAQTFWAYYTDESIALVIFSKEWSPEDNNLFFGYFDEYTEEDEYMCKQNTLFRMWDKIFESEDRDLYVAGDPDEERTESGMMNPKIYKLD